MKVGLLDKKVLSQPCTATVAISTLFALLLPLLSLESASDKVGYGLVLLSLFVCVYLVVLARANLLKTCSIRINGIVIEIREGDIFESDGVVVIPFNEYFDTEISSLLISPRSLNGQYLLRKSPEEIAELDGSIGRDEALCRRALLPAVNRTAGKTIKYQLGSIFQDNNYLLTAMTHFDKSNNARMTIEDYISFLIVFWQEISRTYDGRDVFIPLLGGGITRFDHSGPMTPNDKLVLILMTLRYSKPAMPSSIKLHLILNKEDLNSVDLFHIQDVFPD